MRDFLVYLAGPIAGLTYDQGQDWREYVMAHLPQEIHGISPLRAKAERLARQGVITDTYEDCPLTSQRGIWVRDQMDCLRADALIVNLLGAKSVSIGTMFELAWAALHKVPVILVIEKTGNLHDHPFVREAAGFRVETLDDAIAVAEAVLLPTGRGTVRLTPEFPIPAIGLDGQPTAMRWERNPS